MTEGWEKKMFGNPGKAVIMIDKESWLAVDDQGKNTEDEDQHLHGVRHGI